MAILHYFDGLLLDKEVTLVDSYFEDSVSEVVDAYVTQYYSGRTAIPRYILLPVDIENRKSLEDMLSDEAGRKVNILVPRRGERVQMVNLANENAKEEAERVTTRGPQKNSLRLLQKCSRLEELPSRIEAYDVSNLSGSDVVAAMTVFGGAPLKKGLSQVQH